MDTKRISKNVVGILMIVSILLASSSTIGTASRPKSGLFSLDSCIEQPNNLVSWWPGDGTPEDIIDYSNGMLQGDITFVPGMVRHAFSLDGDGDYIIVPDSPSLNPTTITVDTWIYATDLAGQIYPPIVKKTGNGIDGSTGFSLESGDGYVAFWVFMDDGYFYGVNSQNPINLNTWYHVAGTFDGAEIKLYVDGELQGTTSVTANYIPSSNPLYIGASAADPGRYFKGMIDEVHLYNRALSEAEIQSIYNAGLYGLCHDEPGLLFYDDFNDGNADGWTTSGEGSWYVENNEYVVDMDSIYGIEGLSYAGDVTWTNYVLDIDFLGEQNVDKAFNVRFLDVDHRYGINMRGPGFDDLCISSPSVPATCYYFPNNQNVWYHVTTFAIDERIIVLVNGEFVADWSDNSGNYNSHGEIQLTGWNGDKVRYDNVLVQKIVALSGPENGGIDTDYIYTAASVPISPSESITYTWQATDFPLVTHVGGKTDTITYNWELPGEKIITTTSTTSYGTVTDTFPLVIDEPITGLAATNDSPTHLGAMTHFNASMSTGTNITYTWDFGDGTTGVGEVTSHVYDEIGTYTATVTATNSLGSMIATTEVQINPFRVYVPVIIR